MNPLALFPIEVWEEILNHYDPANKLHLIRSHPVLEAVFEYKKSEWQFSAALPIILGNFYPKTDELGTGNTSLWWKQFGACNRDKGLKRAVLNCRKVSKLCKESVDKFVEAYWKKFSTPPSFTGRVCHGLSKLRWEKMSKFLEHSDNFPLEYKGFLSGYVFIPMMMTVKKDWKGLEVPTDTNVIQFLSHYKVGKYVKGISVMPLFGENDPQRTVNFVRDILLAAPNLQSLTFDFLPYGNEDDQEADLEAAAACEVTFPPLPNLEKVSITESRMHRQRLIPPCIDLKQYFAQLTGLRLHFKLWKEEYNREEISFPKLDSLELLYIPIWDYKDEVSQLFTNLKTPRLKFLLVSASGSSERELSQDEIQESVNFLKLTACNYLTTKKMQRRGSWKFKGSSNEDGRIVLSLLFSPVRTSPSAVWNRRKVCKRWFNSLHLLFLNAIFYKVLYHLVISFPFLIHCYHRQIKFYITSLVLNKILITLILLLLSA